MSTGAQIRSNVILVFSTPKYLIGSLILFAGFLFLGFYFFDYKLSIGNLGYIRTYIDIITHILISILFSIFLAGQVYKVNNVGRINRKTTGTGIFGSLFGIIVTGCPSCSITFASYLGLAGFLSFFPRGGLELKIVSLCLMLGVNFYLYRDLLICKIKFKKKGRGRA